MTTPMLVSLAQARAYLKHDTSDDDATITVLLRGASRMVIEYMRNGADAFTDSAGDIVVDTSGDPIGVPEDVQVATLFMLGILDKNRGSDADKAYSENWLPAPVRAMLAPYRDPPLA